ncbi:MAG: sigma-E processing peptidase SpoIIGA [Clostridia bacterium]|nr:sigma-E processing peptidase SpoIIGA [Clostridia bacterium]
METIIYVDVLFFINFVMDGLCLALTSAFIAKHIVWWRFLCASLIGGLYSVVVIHLDLPSLIAILFHFTTAFVICVVAFKRKREKNTISATLYFFFSNAVLGGVLFALYSLCGCFAVYNGAFYAELSATALTASGVVAATVLLFCITKGKALNMAKYCEAKIVFRGRQCTVSCMADSGNLLVCPYSALPVAIINLRAARELFTENELALLSVSPAMEKVRPLPIKSVGGSAIIPSFLPEKVEILPFGKKEFEEKRLCIGIKLDEGCFGKWDGIIPASLL